MSKIYKRPQVLLLGNGINISNGGERWKDFLLSIKDKEINVDIDDLKSPMPLQAILLSNNKLGDKLKRKSKTLLPTKVLVDSKVSLKTLLSLGFDEILTTNYTYELEQSCHNNQSLTKNKLNRLACDTKGGRVNQKYLITTYNKTIYNDTAQRIWHIHGEAKKPISMILGHYYYGQLTKRIIDYIDEKRNSYYWYQKNEQPIIIKSWIDAFIMGDVYILGQSFDFSEIDLWWLLNRKNNEKAMHGKVYFYEPVKDAEIEKIKLLQVMNVETRNLGVLEKIDGESSFIDYADFYIKAIEDIKTEIVKNKT